MTETRSQQAKIVRSDEGEAFWLPKHRLTIKLGGEDTDGHYGLITSEPPAGTAPPLHVHHGVDEGVWVVRGRVRFRCGEDEFTLGPNDFVLLPRDVPHTFVVEGDEDALMIGLHSPGGSERFYAVAGTPVTGPEPPAGPPDLEAFERANEMFDCETVGPPLSPSA